MNDITLKQLKYFSALRDKGQFGLAADECRISQPAMSTQIKDLEVKLGKVLFERFPRWVELTEFGIIFSQQVDKTLTAYNDLIDLTRTAGDQFCGTLNLGIVSTIAPYFLIPFTLGLLSIKARERSDNILTNTASIRW